MTGLGVGGTVGTEVGVDAVDEAGVGTDGGVATDADAADVDELITKAVSSDDP